MADTKTWRILTDAKGNTSEPLRAEEIAARLWSGDKTLLWAQPCQAGEAAFPQDLQEVRAVLLQDTARLAGPWLSTLTRWRRNGSLPGSWIFVETTRKRHGLWLWPWSTLLAATRTWQSSPPALWKTFSVITAQPSSHAWRRRLSATRGFGVPFPASGAHQRRGQSGSASSAREGTPARSMNRVGRHRWAAEQ